MFTRLEERDYFTKLLGNWCLEGHVLVFISKPICQQVFVLEIYLSKLPNVFAPPSGSTSPLLRLS